MNLRYRVLQLLVVSTAVLVLLLSSGSTLAQDEPTLEQQAAQLLEEMDIAQRVGQLFLVTFEDDTIGNDSAIADLIVNYHVGGVALRPNNTNLSENIGTVAAGSQIAGLTSQLQQLALNGFVVDETEANPESDAIPPTRPPQGNRPSVPLLIASSHRGDKLPYEASISGLSAVPNQMAIGATWNPDYSFRIGEIVGSEFAATGINMLLGPALDVLDNPAPLSSGDLGTGSFGGDPFWTGEMGRHYISGIHQGSTNRVAVVSSSFPGIGGSDRAIHEEVSTVRKSLEQLKQIELAPFFATTADPLGSPATTDALLATHIRYQGFQGNIRATTAPVSLDPQALSALMELPELAGWRQEGGLVVSDVLGARSVERFYDDTEQEFPHRQVAKDALLAGNDLLYVADFALGSGNHEAEITNIQDTIRWFQERYEIDPSFQQRVDEAALRLLLLKLRLYESDFSEESVLSTPIEEVADQNTINETLFSEMAEAATTLLSPSHEELAGRVVTPPGINDKIVLFTDLREVRQCASCPTLQLLSSTAVEERMLELYGPEGSGQVRAANIESFSSEDLHEFLLAGPGPIPLPTVPVTPTLDAAALATAVALGTPEFATPEPTPQFTPTPPADYRVQEALRSADWIVFAMLDGGTRTTAPSANALSRFLAQRPDIAGDAQVVALAMDAPYFLDSTEISKLTAYYGIYSKTNAFVDAAVRALFLDSPLLGAPPVDVEGIRYNLFEQTQPDPAQIIELFFVSADNIESPSSQQPSVAQIGDTVALQTGVVVDRLAHAVPDGTLVRFILHDRVQGTVTIIGDRPTEGGIAHLDYVLDARMGPGQFRITAESGDALVSQEVDITIEGEAQLAIIVPTEVPTATLTPSATPTETPMPTETVTPIPPTATPVPPAPEPEGPTGWLVNTDLGALGILMSGLGITLVLGLVISGIGTPPSNRRLGQVLWGLAGGLLAYNYLRLGLPGSERFDILGAAGGAAIVIAGGVIGLAVYRVIHRK